MSQSWAPSHAARQLALQIGDHSISTSAIWNRLRLLILEQNHRDLEELFHQLEAQFGFQGDEGASDASYLSQARCLLQLAACRYLYAEGIAVVPLPLSVELDEFPHGGPFLACLLLDPTQIQSERTVDGLNILAGLAEGGHLAQLICEAGEGWWARLGIASIIKL
ncbi:hypothetical protein PG991_008958 [Apiospora marii]|uniref:Uncharacterized protein n=1 Tax=Apiospora marii TaxID=335849 RepID=A0ABR1RJC6_9PEZI